MWCVHVVHNLGRVHFVTRGIKIFICIWDMKSLQHNPGWVNNRKSIETPPQKWRSRINRQSKTVHPSPSERPPEVWSVDVGGTTLPGLKLETAKEHTRVSCGWPDARDACKARPTIEAQGLASPHHRSPAWPHRPIKTDLLLSFFSPLPHLCVSPISPSLSLTFSLALPPPTSTKHAHTFLFSYFAPLIAADWKKKKMERGEWDWKKETERGREGKGVIPQNLYGQDKVYWPPEIVKTPLISVFGLAHPAPSLFPSH